MAPTFKDEFTRGQEVTFTCCLAFFVLEMLLKINIWGPVSFIRNSTANGFDLAIVSLGEWARPLRLLVLVSGHAPFDC
jgi:hypothetical protein